LTQKSSPEVFIDPFLLRPSSEEEFKMLPDVLGRVETD